jgi:oligoribonuclease
MAMALPHLIWIDCEMTGLDLVSDALVEIAVLVTDSELNIIGDGVDLVIRATAGQLEAMGDFVRQMHTSSGLITQIPDGISVGKAEEEILNYLQSAGVEAGKSPLAGNSVSVDRNFIARDMPLLSSYLHYRTIDVSTIKELARRWHPKVFFAAPPKTGNHRALGDIQDSIAELAYYRNALFTPAEATIEQDGGNDSSTKEGSR